MYTRLWVSLICLTVLFHDVTSVSMEDAILDEYTPLVLSFTYEKCGGSCDKWTQWIETLNHTHTNVSFFSVTPDFMLTFDSQLSFTTNNITIRTFPNAIFLYKDVQVVFNREINFESLKRWLDDCLYGMTSQVFVGNTDQILDFRRRFNGSVVILTPKFISFNSMVRLNTVGFAEQYSDIERPMYFVRSVFGKERVFTSAKHIFHGLVGIIIPYNESFREDVVELTAYYGGSEFAIVQEGQLASWWYDFAALYTDVIFVHYQPHETDLPSPSVTVFNRSTTYQRNSTDIETIRWYHDVVHGRAHALQRRSNSTSDVHKTVVDITGDNMWSMLKKHEEIYVALYDDADNRCANKIGDRSEKHINSSIVYARMHVGINDHETLPKHARSGLIFGFKNGSKTSVEICL